MSRLACPIPSCDLPRPGNAAVCGACTADLQRALDTVQWLPAELDVTLAKQHTRTGGGMAEVEDDRAPAVLHIGSLAYDPRASEALYVLRSALVGWVRVLSEGLQVRHGPVCASCEHRTCRLIPWSLGPQDTCQSMAAWLSAGLSRLLRHPAGVEAHGELVAAVEAAVRVVDRPAGFVYAGPCEECGYALYAKPGATIAQCRKPDCDADAIDIDDRREWMREECKDLLGSPSYVAMVCTGLGATVTPSTVRVWISRKKIHPRHFVRPMTEHGEPRPLYRVGDVLKRIAGEAREEAYSA